MSKMALRKSRRFVIFLVTFFHFWTDFGAIGIYRKTGPTKSTVLGPGPPPWEIHKIYRFLPFFHLFGVFNRAGKTVSKIGIYALPPLKSDFYRILLKMGLKFIGSTVFSLKYFIVDKLGSDKLNGIS
jgi:hypothetical protein